MNHSRVDIQTTSISCGVVQISRISDDLEDVLFAIGTRFYHAAHGNPPAFVLWSNLADVETNGHRITNLIAKLGLGDVHQTPKEVNPNTGAVICVWIWQVKHEVFKDWYKKTKINKLENQYPTKK